MDVLNISPAEFRHRLLSANSSKLPPGYYECEYIESNGKQFIDTGYKFTSDNIGIDIEIANLNTDPYYCLFGSENQHASGSNGGDSIIAYCSSTMAHNTIVFEITSNVTNARFTLVHEEKTRIKVDVKGGVSTITVGEETQTWSTAGYSDKLYNFYLCACNINGTVDLFSKNRIYSCILYDNGVKVRDYIPCVNPEGYFGLYDTVSKTFFRMKERITTLQTQTVKGYSIDLQNQWRKSTTYTVSSPKDGFYESNSNYNVDGGSATCIITVEPGVTDLLIHPAVSSESSYDYLNIYTFYLDGTQHINFWSKSGNDTIASNITLSGYNVSNNVNSTMLSQGYQIRCTYSKDGSNHSYNDRGYFYLTGGYVTKQVEIETIVDTIGAGKVIIPENYTWVDCIYGSGGAFINTNYKPNSNTKLLMQAELFNATDFPFLFGTVNSTGYGFRLNTQSVSKWQGTFGQGKYVYPETQAQNTPLNIEAGLGSLKINDASASYSNTSYSCTTALALFASNENGTISKYVSSMHLYHCAITESSQLKRLFVPCQNASNVYGLFDVVNKQFYTSASNIAFEQKMTLVSYDFPFKAAAQQVTLQPGLYKLEVWGAQGGCFSSSTINKGGYSVGYLNLTNATNAYVHTGGQPASITSGSAGTVNPGGYNGGGSAQTVSYSSTTTYGQGGGGGTDIRLVSNSLYNRVIVAGGGAGASDASSSYKVHGGGTTGGNGSGSFGGTQTTGGSSNTLGTFGQGANAVPSSTNYKYAASGGGGGWYGGGSSTVVSDSSNSYRYNCGGGSGFTLKSGVTTPSNYALNSNYYLTNTVTKGGDQTFVSPTGADEAGHEGNGYARITQVIDIGTPQLTIDWSIKAGSWTSASYSSSMDGLKWTCQSPGHDGMTVIRCTFSGISSITFNCVYSGENNFDYLTISKLDTGATRESYGTTLKGNSGTARDVTFTCDPGVSHYVEFCYSKDSSDTSGSDNATVYIKSYS